MKRKTAFAWNGRPSALYTLKQNFYDYHEISYVMKEVIEKDNLMPTGDDNKVSNKKYLCKKKSNTII